MEILAKKIITGNKIEAGMEIIHPKTGGIVEVLAVRPPATGQAYQVQTTGGFILVFADEQILKI